MTDRCTFDDSLPRAIEIVFTTLPHVEPKHVRFIRDMSGYIHVIVAGEIGDEKLQTLRSELSSALGPYSPGEEDGALRVSDTFSGDALFKEPVLIVSEGEKHAYVIERRAVGQDWLASLSKERKHPPRTVFYSLKGGVGRSTALLLCGRHLAEQGHKVLVVDLDLEAPGLGAQLLPPDSHPDYGVLDWLVEDIVGAADDTLVERMGAESPVGAPGLVAVPAMGARALERPENVIGKLSRAYLEGSDDTSESPTFAARLRRMVEALERVYEPDIVLIDSRAGLHETVAANLLHLEAHVLLFAVNLPVTWQGYRFLFAHLQQLAQTAEVLQKPNHMEWRQRLKMVHARADATDQEERKFASQAYGIWVDTLYDQKSPDNDDDESFSHAQEDVDAPHWPLTIPRNDQFERLDPLKDLSGIGEHMIERDFGDLFAFVSEIIEDSKATSDDA